MYLYSNIILKHEGPGASSDNIKTLKPYGKDSINLYTSRLIKNTDLIFSCEWNGTPIKSVIYKNLSSNDLTTISFFFNEKEGTLKYSILVSNDIDVNI